MMSTRTHFRSLQYHGTAELLWSLMQGAQSPTIEEHILGHMKDASIIKINLA